MTQFGKTQSEYLMNLLAQRWLMTRQRRVSSEESSTEEWAGKLQERWRRIFSVFLITYSGYLTSKWTQTKNIYTTEVWRLKPRKIYNNKSLISQDAPLGSSVSVFSTFNRRHYFYHLFMWGKILTFPVNLWKHFCHNIKTTHVCVINNNTPNCLNRFHSLPQRKRLKTKDDERRRSSTT